MAEFKANDIFGMDGAMCQFVGVRTDAAEQAIVYRVHPENPEPETAYTVPVAALRGRDIRTEAGDDAVAKFALALREKRTIRELFGLEMDVPEPSDADMQLLHCTERVFGEKNHFRLFYTPDCQMFKDKMLINGKEIPYPDTWIRPDSGFFRNIDAGVLSTSSRMIHKRWMLFDTTKPSPAAAPGERRKPYPNDPLIPIIERLTAEGKIRQETAGSRNNFSYKKDFPHIAAALAQALEHQAGRHLDVIINVPHATLVNYLYNVHNLGIVTSMWEWTSDFSQADNLATGYGGNNGITVMMTVMSPSEKADTIGFRPVIFT